MSGEMIRLLRSFDDDVGRRRCRGWWRTLLVFSAIKALGFVVVATLVWLSLSHVTVTPGSLGNEPIWGVLTTAIQAIFLLQIADFAAMTSMSETSGSGASIAAYAHALKAVAAARDGRLSRIVPVTASPSASAAAAARESTLSPLAHPMRMLGLSDAVYVIGALAGAAMFGLGVALFVFSLRVPPSIMQPATLASWFEWLTFPCLLLLIGGAGAAAALIVRRYAGMEREDFTATIDADGVTFAYTSTRSQSRRLRWRDARSLALITFTDVMGRLHEVFVLSSSDADFLWEALYVRPTMPSEQMQKEAAWGLAAHQMVDQVIQHTGLPLLDLSQTIAATAATDVPASSSAASMLLARASIIARQRGGLTLGRELAQRLGRRRMPPIVGQRLLARAGVGMNRLSSAQRDDTLRLARELLPYYPPFGSAPHNPQAWLRFRIYRWSEFILQLVVCALPIASAFYWFLVAS